MITGSNRRSSKQHETPCEDCPWRRKSLPGWVGPYEPEELLRFGHNDEVYPCHVIVNQQCAGIAIYRANVIKRCDPPNLRLPKDPVTVFALPTEFLEHHKKRRL